MISGILCLFITLFWIEKQITDSTHKVSVYLLIRDTYYTILTLSINTLAFPFWPCPNTAGTRLPKTTHEIVFTCRGNFIYILDCTNTTLFATIFDYFTDVLSISLPALIAAQLMHFFWCFFVSYFTLFLSLYGRFILLPSLWWLGKLLKLSLKPAQQLIRHDRARPLRQRSLVRPVDVAVYLLVSAVRSVMNIGRTVDLHYFLTPQFLNKVKKTLFLKTSPCLSYFLLINSKNWQNDCQYWFLYPCIKIAHTPEEDVKASLGH